MSLTALDEIGRRLAAASGSPGYRVPGLWADPYGAPDPLFANPASFYLARINGILATPAEAVIKDGEEPGGWSRYAAAYNLFVRAGAAWDHDGDGVIATRPLAGGWRETGTFIKAIALLPFIRSLGCNTVHLLPVTSIGQDGHKGNLGSPFAIRDPYALEPGLAEPALCREPGAEPAPADVDLQFAAFVEAAHHLGLRVVTEFVFRTAAKDAAWAGEHPEWFYWVRADVPDREPGDTSPASYGAPLFPVDQLADIYARVDRGDFTDLPAPGPEFRAMFTPPPRPEDVRLVDGRWLGAVADPVTGQRIEVRVPGAFCDWTPDSDQPPWTDVTYLRLYDHPALNYIAYNTVRMYDTRLAQPANAVLPLWERITEVIPHYQQRFGIDGVMIDMGHALPAALKHRIVARAREVDPDFALWAEDFRLAPEIRAEGYNVILGPYLQMTRDLGRFRQFLAELAERGTPVPFMATPENHNCPRAAWWPGGLTYSRYAGTMGALLPGIAYIHGGYELGETAPINTGFDFSAEQQAALPASALPLFSAGAFDWARQPNAIEAVRQALAVRSRYLETIADPRPERLHLIDAGNPQVLALLRGETGSLLGILANGDMERPQATQLILPAGQDHVTDLLSGAQHAVRADGVLALMLEPGQIVVYEVRAGAPSPRRLESAPGAKNAYLLGPFVSRW